MLLHPHGVEPQLLGPHHFLERFPVVVPAFDRNEADLEPRHDHPFTGERPGGAPGPSGSSVTVADPATDGPFGQYTPVRKGARPRHSRQTRPRAPLGTPAGSAAADRAVATARPNWRAGGGQATAQAAVSSAMSAVSRK